MFAGAAASVTLGIWARSSASSSAGVEGVASSSTTTAPTTTPAAPRSSVAPVASPPTSAPLTPLAHDLSEGMVVTADIWEQMNEDFCVAPRRSPGGNHMEVYLPEQVSVLFSDGEARVISHVSSGEGITWCDEVEIDLDDGTTEPKGICGRSVTPGGLYQFERKVEGVAQRKARASLQAGLLQLRHRHSRCWQRP